MRRQWKAKYATPKQCEFCSKLLQRRRNAAGRLEGYRDFVRRRFCSLSCANSRSKGGESRKAYHYRARKVRLNECECCGTAKRLQVHHVDENWKNNVPSNLQTLCIFCHHFWHATHIRLGLKPAERMPRLVSRSQSTRGAEWDDCAVTAMQSLPKSRKRSLKPT